MEELQVNDVEQLLIQSPYIDDVAGQEAGPLSKDQKCQQEGTGQKTQDSRVLKTTATPAWYSPFAHEPLMLFSQAFSAERQNYQPRAIDEHGRAAPIRVHPYTRRMHILHKAILGAEGTSVGL